MRFSKHGLNHLHNTTRSPRELFLLSRKTNFLDTYLLQDIMQHKLVFIETQDVVETTLALDNYRRACDCGRGAVFFSVARYYFH